MWSEYWRIRERRRQPSANSFASAFRCSVTAVPRSAHVHGLDGEIAVGAGFPLHARLRRGAGLAGNHFHPVGNNEGRVEADAELADERGVLLLVARERS